MVIFNSSDMTKGVPGRMGVYGTKHVGVITIASNTTLSSATTDTLPICPIPKMSYLANLLLNIPAIDGGNGLTLSLVDNLASATTYISASTLGQGGGTLTMANITLAVLGQQYGETAIAIGGSAGTKEVVWVTGTNLLLSVAHTATNTSGASALNIVYMVEWAPTYQA